MGRCVALGLLLGVLISGEASAACKVLKADVPVTMEGGRALVPATMNGKSVKLELDSGAFSSIIDEDVAKAIGLPLTDAEMDVEGVGGRVPAQLATVKRFALAGIDGGRNRPFVVVPFAQDGAAVGLLGGDVLGNYDVEYDLPSGLIRLMKVEGCGDNLAYWSDGSGLSTLPITPISAGQWHTIGTVIVNGQRLRAMFDTGAGHSVIKLAAAKRAGVHPTDASVNASDVVGGVGRHLRESWIGEFSEIQIGDEKIRNTQLMISDGLLSDVDMLVGADFFLSHRVLVAHSKNRMFFTYSGGRVFRLDGPATKLMAADENSAAAKAPADPARQAGVAINDPHDAGAFERRGTAKLAHQDYRGALLDLDKAVDLGPNQASAFYHRALAHRSLDQPAAAVADVDAALRLRPRYAEALLLRAELDGGRDASRRQADLAAAVEAARDQWGIQVAAARLYAAGGDYVTGVAVLDHLIASQPGDVAVTDALAMRCAIRMNTGHDLDRALDDCNAVLKRRGRNSEALAQRALVQLRRGEAAQALADFNASLKLQPKFSAALYGRGLARKQLGDSVGAEADLQAARALDPKVGKAFASD